jgi:triphosphoribosyl-dephospho-CoA synthase
MTAPLPSPGKLAQFACILEATARKPGNVHRYRDFEDLDYLDFILSATSITDPLDRAWSLGIGRAVLEAVRETRRVVSTNTNLGIILLLTPLAAVSPPVNLRQGVKTVLKAASVEDSRFVFEAIRLAQPGGMGKVPEQDLSTEPSLNLVDVMKLAADRDLIARQYVNGYSEVFDIAVPALKDGLNRGLGVENAIIHTHLSLLASRPDTLIERKCGKRVAEEASRLAKSVLSGGWPADGHAALVPLDAWLVADGHARNPGATADLVTAALFVALRDGILPFPRTHGTREWSGASA